MGDMQVGVANIDDKGFYGLMEDIPVKAVASSNPILQVSISFGRFENDSLSWEKFSAFSPNKYLEEVGKCATPGSVAQKKAYFEAHYKKIAERKAEIMMDQEKEMGKDESFVSDQGNMEGESGGSVAESEVDDGSNGPEDKYVSEIAAQVNESSIDELNEETVTVKECLSSDDQVKEEVKDSLDSPVSEIALVEGHSEVDVVQVQDKPEEVLQVNDAEEKEAIEEVISEIPTTHTTGDRNETPMKVVKKERKPNLIKKNDGNARIKITRGSPKPNQVTTKPTTNKIVTSKKTPPSKEIKSMIKTTKKPAAPISKAPPGLSTPRVYKQPPSKVASLSTSHSSLKKETASALLRNKQTTPKSLHMSMSLGPSSASDPAALTGTRKSLIMERMGDKDIVKRAFQSFRKSYDFSNSVDGQNTPLKQNPAKATSVPSVATQQKENGRSIKASSMDKRSSTNTPHFSRGLKSSVTADKQPKELSKSSARPVEKTRLQTNPKARVVDTKTRRDSLTPKAKPMQGSLPVPAVPKGSLGKVL